MRQNGHRAEFESYKNTRADYDRQPAKPVIDGEPIYEGHPVSFKAEEFGHSIAADCRRALYWDLFTGACGHTYGHHTMWQFYDSTREPKNNPLLPWREAIDDPGATQMIHGRRLIESRPVLSRIPDDSLIVSCQTRHVHPRPACPPVRRHARRRWQLRHGLRSHWPAF